MEKKESTGNKPEKKFKAGAVSATVWLNQSVKDGKAVEYRTISIERVYRDKNEEWKYTGSLRVNDLPKACLALQKAYEYIVLKSETSDLPTTISAGVPADVSSSNEEEIVM